MTGRPGRKAERENSKRADTERQQRKPLPRIVTDPRTGKLVVLPPDDGAAGKLADERGQAVD
jgi:hypothetical protein